MPCHNEDPGCYFNPNTDKNWYPDDDVDLSVFMLGITGQTWWQKLGLKDNPTNLRLTAQWDCIGGFGREIEYALKTISGDDPNGQYFVTEHQTNPDLTDKASSQQRPGGTGTTTDPAKNSFNDTLGGLQFGASSLQYFTISTGSPATTPGYPVTVRNDYGDYGVLGLFNDGGRILVNGTWPNRNCN